eukprot:12140270-Alexandrium_andersonii.AAC.1
MDAHKVAGPSTQSWALCPEPSRGGRKPQTALSVARLDRRKRTTQTPAILKRTAQNAESAWHALPSHVQNAKFKPQSFKARAILRRKRQQRKQLL